MAACFYDVKVKFKNGGTAVGRGIGNNATWACVCGELLLGPHEDIYDVPPCPGCNRAYRVHRGTKPTFVKLVEELRVSSSRPGTKGVGMVRNLGRTDHVRRAIAEFKQWCEEHGFLFEPPSKASALYELDGERYVRLEREGPRVATLAVYRLPIDGSPQKLDVPAPKAFEACWPGEQYAVLRDVEGHEARRS